MRSGGKVNLKIFNREIKVRKSKVRYYDVQLSILERLYIFYNELTFSITD